MKKTPMMGFLFIKNGVFDEFINGGRRLIQLLNKMPPLWFGVIYFAEIASCQRLIRLSGLIVASVIFAIGKQ